MQQPEDVLRQLATRLGVYRLRLIFFLFSTSWLCKSAGIAIAHFFQKISHQNKKKNYIHYRITKFNKHLRLLQILRLFQFFIIAFVSLCFVAHIRQKFENVLTTFS